MAPILFGVGMLLTAIATGLVMVIMKPQKLCDIFKCVITQHDTTKRIREQGTAASLSLANSFIMLVS